jgi:sulfocyanin SoxE-like protein
MLNSLTHRRQVVFLGILVSISVNGCSKAPDRAPSTEAAASSASNPVVAESSATNADTSTMVSANGSSAASVPEKPSPDTPPQIPKPSIDPGRKSAKPVTVPRPAVKPTTDSAAAPAAAASSAGQDQVLKYDAGTNTATFELIAGPFNFNGYTNGGATLLLPSKANVVMNFVNKDGTPHSAEVISGEGPIPNAAVDPAIPRAYTNKVLEGLPQEARDVMRFTVPESGNYRIFCGVPGHGLSGMWIWMRIDPAAKAPSFGPTKS